MAIAAKAMQNPPLILASGSRYRRELLARLQWPFVCEVSDVGESPQEGETPAATALRLAEAKARAIARRHSQGLVIGSDQVADCGGAALSKPGDHASAVAMLGRLSGREVVFHTALVLLDAGSGRVQRELVSVVSTFRHLTPAQIDAYLVREKPYDCAGAVKSEALGIALFDRIESADPTALIGLPLIALVRMLRAEGCDVLASR